MAGEDRVGHRVRTAAILGHARVPRRFRREPDPLCGTTDPNAAPSIDGPLSQGVAVEGLEGLGRRGMYSVRAGCLQDGEALFSQVLPPLQDGELSRPTPSLSMPSSVEPIVGTPTTILAEVMLLENTQDPFGRSPLHGSRHYGHDGRVVSLGAVRFRSKETLTWNS